MSSTMCATILLVIATITCSFSETCGSKIYSLSVPEVVRNGTGPIDLSCIYNVREDENGLVVKWYHNTQQIYQWIPPMPPQDVGIINGFAEYPNENLKEPLTRSVIHLKIANLEMSGKYVCTIGTFQEEDYKSSEMIVYVPEDNVTIHVSSFNDSHLNLTCVANGAQPTPIIKIFVEGTELHHYRDNSINRERYRNRVFETKRTSFVRNSLEPILVECEISIPQTDYKRREKMVYYPSSAQMLSQTSGASKQAWPNDIFLFILTRLW